MSGFCSGGFPPHPDGPAEEPAVLVGLAASRSVKPLEDSKGTGKGSPHPACGFTGELDGRTWLVLLPPLG